ncbi:MAG TPA: beta-propeller domain-containing protein [Chthoniobacteraceae bacterium]|nr:beta-propeller domain-containing protein [Chthoniobacteraceae bacterium]
MRPAAAAPAPVAQIAGAEPAIHAVHGRVVSITVPAGFASVSLQVLTAPPKGRSAPGVKPPGPTWQTVASKLVNSQAALVQLEVPRLTSLRLMRVFGVKTEPLPEGLRGDITSFPADPENAQGGGPTLSLGAINSTLDVAGTASTSAASASTADTGTTRTVTESDIWKIDGDRLYYYNGFRGLQVFDLSQPDQPSLLGTLPMPGAGEQMYLLDPSHAVLLRNENYGWSWIDWDYRWNLGGAVVSNSGISLQATTNATLTLSASPQTIQSAASIVRLTPIVNPAHSVVVVDVSKGEPVILAELPFSGSLQESRLVGQVLYVASNVYETSPTTGGVQWGLRLTSFDLADPAHPVQRASVFAVGWAGAVTATDQYFLVAGPYSYPATVQAFDISDPHGAIVKAGQVSVPGAVADKFKMDQRGTTLTVVSSGWRANADSVWNSFSVVSTFSLADPLHPRPLGTLDGPAGEQLYATRFDGSRLYMVTAVRNWDPLWIIDLSQPAQPTVLGSVEMPGYSTFIQPLGDRLVAMGLVNGKPTVDLYDVGDATAPSLLSRVDLGVTGAWVGSEATWNEKAFNVLPESNLILLPLSTSGLDGSFGGVQLIDLLPDRLVKRGAVQHKFFPRRAGLHGNRIVSIAANGMLIVNADDRDHPVVTADLEIAWPVDRTFLVGPWLLELGGSPSGNEPPTLTIAPADAPDATAATLALPNLAIMAATARKGVLYVMQGAAHYHTNLWDPGNSQTAYQVLDGTTLTLSTIDVSQLPKVQLLSQVTVDQASTDYILYDELKPLWVNDRTLLFSHTSVYRPYYTVNSLAGGVISANTLSAASTSLASSTLTTASIAPTAPTVPTPVTEPLQATITVGNTVSFFWWNKNTTEFFAFDVGSPARPKYASHVKLDQDGMWQSAAPLTTGDKVYLSYKVLWRDTREKLPPGVPDPVNRHFLKVIDYSDNTAPVVAAGGINLPGELRALGRQGTVLYTVGPLLDRATGSLQGNGRAVQASSFDGAAAHLLDELPLDSSAQPFLVSGDALLVLHPQPAHFWQWDYATGTYASNPAHTTLDSWSLGDDGKFSLGATLTLDHELSVGRVNTLGVLRNNDPTVRLLDLGDPLHPSDLGVYPIHANGSSSLDHADGDAARGLWLPLGREGVDVISLAP